MCLVELRYGVEIIRPRPRQFLLGLDVFQHRTDAELLAFSCQTQRLGGGGEVLLRRGNLVQQRLRAGVAFHDLASDFILDFCAAQSGGFQARFACAHTAEIKQAARPNPPAKPDEVILGFAEVAGAVILPAAKSANKSLCAERRNQRPVNCAVPRIVRSGNQRLALLQLGTRPERLLN